MSSRRSNPITRAIPAGGRPADESTNAKVMIPALGTAAVVYLPGERLLGLGTLAALVDACARRLTMQEQIGQAVVDALMGATGARGAVCEIELRHACLCARGARQARATVRTLAAAGDLAQPAREAEVRHLLRR